MSRWPISDEMRGIAMPEPTFPNWTFKHAEKFRVSLGLAIEAPHRRSTEAISWP